MDTTHWRALQRLLSKLIRAPEGVLPGLARLHPDEQALWTGSIRHHGALDPAERVEIYANMYFYRLHDVLADDFPTLRATVGGPHFHNLVTEYLRAHPSRHFSLRYAGEAFPAFVRQHALCQRWPWLGDLAALEWAVVDAFDAADASTIGPEELARLPPAAWGRQQLVWSPSLRVLHCAYPVQVAWQQQQEDEPLSHIAPGPTWLRVWRHEEKVFVRAVDPQEAGVLGTNATLADIAANLAEHSSAAAAADQLATWMAEWVVAGLIAGLRAFTDPEGT